VTVLAVEAEVLAVEAEVLASAAPLRVAHQYQKEKAHREKPNRLV
tara:strand:+ start:271 stop:405 length:135 start_codon:yes stop_codon:yes gene_type:complete